MPTLTVKATGFPSLPVTRAGRPGQPGRDLAARRLVIPGIMMMNSSPP